MFWFSIGSCIHVNLASTKHYTTSGTIILIQSGICIIVVFGFPFSFHNPLSSAEAPYERFVCLGGRVGSDGKRKRAGGLSSLFPLSSIPHVLPFLSLPRPTAKKPLRSKQYERGLCGGESFIINSILTETCKNGLFCIQ